MLAVVGVLIQQVITLVLPEGRKTRQDDEVYQMEIRETYVNSDADYIVWTAYGSPKIRWDVVNVIARDNMAVVYLKKQ